MEQSLISVVMVNYNHEDFIGRAIESVLGQTWKNLEFIIVDDGSTDASPEIIRQYADRDPRIRPYLQKENNHISYVTNLGLSKVTGSYVARIDSDDIWCPEKLERQVQYMEAHPEGALCFTKLDIINEKEEIVNDSMMVFYQMYNSRQEDRRGWIRHFFFYGNSLIQSTLLMKREVVDRIGGFNLAYLQSHDFDYFVRAIRHFDFIFLEEPLTKYRRTENQNSAWDEATTRRFLNEHMNIRYHYFDDMSDELFTEVFQEDFVKKDSKSHEELLCEQAFLLCRCIRGEDINPVLGAKKLLDIMQDPDMLVLLKEKYQFTPKTFYDISIKPMFTTDSIMCELEYLKRLRPMLEERVEGLVAANETLNRQVGETNKKMKELTEENQRLKETIHQIEQTKTWKLRKLIKH